MNKPILVYDFDGTLTPNSVPTMILIDELGYTHDKYELKMRDWLAHNPTNDVFDAYYMTFLNILKECNLSANDETFVQGANQSNYNPGTLEYFEAVKHSAHHYLVSSGFKVPLEHSSVAPYFDKIFGTIFAYDENKNAVGIHYAMSDKRKVDKIKEICELHGRSNYDCTNMIYLGDGLTDAPAMLFVKEHGGTPIFVYQPHDNQSAFLELKEKGIVDLAYVADYRLGSDLYNKLIELINE